MADSPTQSAIELNNTPCPSPRPPIPIEIISDEEMALIEAALAATRPSLSCSSSSSTQFQRSARSIHSITLTSKRQLSGCTETGLSSVGDIEDGRNRIITSPRKKNRFTQSLLHRFRRKRGLAVTDITATEWCEKQMEYFLLIGKPEVSKAMKAGSIRHAVLEEEVVKRVKVSAQSKEDVWAIKIINFMVGANQLLFDGLTRELPIIGFAEGVWMVGVIDEIRMPTEENDRFPILVDTKTRVRATLPSEPQRRNGRLQLMCYKLLWDNVVADKFPSGRFFDFFSLNPNRILSAEIRENTNNSGFPAETLGELMGYFRNACSMLPRAHDKLLLRYELQEDQSFLGEDEFAHDSDWVKSQIQCCLEFWRGDREAICTPMEERWKCKSCKFAEVCPAGNAGLPSLQDKTQNINKPSSSSTSTNHLSRTNNFSTEL
ncbi:PREDICTED: exonuclease V, chloroplastic [Ipomoea nil]|uniref:exonuclease V, chloroplastic n=1 Tax=Ipomoea nil TaxID=35883 RepID=UPI00090106EB|nr:PREDICTED: exonuclease V, chloroplastic [Ipomoea nil]